MMSTLVHIYVCGSFIAFEQKNITYSNDFLSRFDSLLRIVLISL